jgi:opacity protein-like surface antigen
MKRIAAAVLVFAVTAGPALAQGPPPASLRGFAGVSFMSEAGGTFGVGVGVRLGTHLEAIGEIGRLTNMLPHQIQRDLDEAARLMRPFYGDGLSIDGKAPALYGFGGVRVNQQTGSRLTLFAEAGAGVARGTSDITAFAGQRDVSADVTAALRIKHSDTRPLLALGGGVLIPVTRTVGVDLGYRYMRIFTDDPRINTGTMSAALRWAF